MAERIGKIPFQELVKTAPEANARYVTNLVTGESQEWPYKLVEQPDPTKAVFVAYGGLAGSPSRVEVSYEESLGLSAKRILYYRRPEFGQNFLIEGGEIRVKSGDLDVVYAAAYNAIFVFEDLLNNHSNFTPIISVDCPDVSVPPLAHANFDPNGNGEIPIKVNFLLADFEGAVKGDIEQRRGTFDSRPTYRTNYFSLNKEGRRTVGVSRFEDSTSTFAGKEYSHFHLRFSGWWHDGNARRQLEGSDYAAKISSLNNQLRFARQNTKTGEVWMLSVPEGIQQEAFYGDVINLPMAEFIQKYPVDFAVKKKGERPTWARSSVRT